MCSPGASPARNNLDPRGLRTKGDIMKNRLAGVVLAAALALTAACATTVRLEVLKPAEIDMGDARTVAVMDYSASESGTSSLDDFFVDLFVKALGGETEAEARARNIARYATNTMIAELLDTGYFTVVSSQDVRNAFSGRKGRLGPGDIGERFGAKAVIVGDIARMSADLDRFSRREKVYDERLQKKVKVEVPWVRLKTELLLSYRVIETGSGTIIATRKFRERREAEQPADRKADLPDPDDMYREMIDGIMAQAARQLAPHVEIQTRSLMGDQQKDPRMKQADDLVKNGFLEQARDMFREIWSATGNVAAGYNGAIMCEALGDINEAVDLMGDVVDASQDETVFREYQRLQAVRDERRRAENQLR